MTIDFDKTPAWRRYLRFWASDAKADVAAELSFHLESRVAELVAAGMTAEQARREAQARMGDLSRIRADCEELARARERHMKRSEWLTDVRQDLRYGWRSLMAAPGFTLVAVISLALGIGATTAIFSLLYAVLFERLPLPQPEQLVEVVHMIEQSGTSFGTAFSSNDYEELSRTPGISLAASTSSSATIGVEDSREYLSVDMVSGGYFTTLGVRPMLGRLLSAADDQSRSPVVVISAAFWRRHFQADPAVIGRSLTINGAPFTLIGVTDADYRGLTFPGNFSLAIPQSSAHHGGLQENGPTRNVAIVGRFTTEISRKDVDLRLQSIFSECCARFDTRFGREFIEMRDISRGRTNPKFDAREMYGRLLWTLLGGVLVFLTIACTNVGALMLARTDQRSGELAVRLSLGATRGRLIRQLLTESLQVALIGAVAGFLFARWGLAWLSQRLPDSEMQLLQTVELGGDLRVLGFASAITILSSLLFGVVPAFRATRVDLAARAQQVSRRVTASGRGRLNRTLIAAQFALALLLVSTAALFAQTLRNLQRVDAGFARSQLLVSTVETRGTSYEPNGIAVIHHQILERVRSLPGVRDVALAALAPVHGGRTLITSIDIPSYVPGPDESTNTHINAVTPGFFQTARIGLRTGRDFDSLDHDSSEPVAIVSESFAERYFVGRSPLGATISINDHARRVVGIAADVRYDDPRAPVQPTVYLPVTQHEKLPFLMLLVRTAQKPSAAAVMIDHEMEAVTPGLRVGPTVTMERAFDELLIRERLAAGLALFFGVFALALAAVGIYGVTAHHIHGRTAEIGVRRALGAPAPSVLWLVLRQLLLTLVIGASIGVAVALLAGRAISKLLYGIQPFDPLTLTIALVILLVTGLVAGLVPARRAMGIDPLGALRLS